MEIDKKKYEEYVKQVTPTHSLAKNMAAAFLVGGIICVLGQFALNFMMNNMGMDQENSSGLDFAGADSFKYPADRI